MRLFVAAIVKDEHDSLIEWIAYHKILGVRGFFIADNASRDGTRELLHAFQSAGVLTVFDHPNSGDKKPQLPAYNRILRACSKDVDVLAFIDADEFLLPLDNEMSIMPYVERLFASDDISAVALNWANFGSSGELFASDGLVTERFTRRAKQSFNVNQNFKSLVRPQRVKNFANPHYANLRSGRYVNAIGDDLVLHERHGKGVSAEVVWQGARVNHYAVKSLEEFLLGKYLRGSAATHNRVKHKAYFTAHDRNEEVCEIAASLAPRVHEEVLRLHVLAEPYLAAGLQSKQEGILTRLGRLMGRESGV